MAHDPAWLRPLAGAAVLTIGLLWALFLGPANPAPAAPAVMGAGGQVAGVQVAAAEPAAWASSRLAAPAAGAEAGRPSQAGARLSVIGGGGSGAYPPGTMVYVEPYRMPDMRVFDRWAGGLPPSVDGKLAAQAHLSFTMPARDLVITASLRTAPLWAWNEAVTARGGRVFFQPPGPIGQPGGCGAIVLLHDAGQGAEFWLRGTEARLFQRAAVARCQGLLVLESADRAGGRWDTASLDSGTNRDLAQLAEALHLAGLGGLPVVLLGVGQGGDFAALAARAFLPLSSLHVVATVLVGSAGIEPRPEAPLPTLFVLSARDDPVLNALASQRAAAMVVQGTPAKVLELGPWPIQSTRLWRIDGFSLDEAVEAYTLLLRRRILDPQGRVTRDPSGLDDPGLPAALAPAWPQVREQLIAGWAGHGFSSHGAETMLRFAEDHWGRQAPLPTPSPTRMAYAASIEVIRGSQSKSEQSGGTAWYGDRDLVHIWADPDPPGQVFDRWTGDTAGLADPLARHTSFRVNAAGPHRLVATFRPAPDWQAEEREIGGRRVYVRGSPAPSGLIFFLHGGGGGAAAWVGEQNIENRWLLRDVVAQGYTVAVPESADRPTGRWSALPAGENPDIQHLNQVRQRLVASGELAADSPIFGVGMSNGGAFAARAADALGWQAAAIYAAGCPAGLAETTDRPLIWLLGENDRVVSNQNALACHQRLVGRGIAGELYVNGPSPVYPERFWRLAGVDVAASRAAQAALRSARVLDRLDFQHRPPLEVAPSISAALGGVATVPVDLATEQMELAFAEHRFTSDLNHRVLAFFARHRATAPPPRPSPTPVRQPPRWYLPIAGGGS